MRKKKGQIKLSFNLFCLTLLILFFSFSILLSSYLLALGTVWISYFLIIRAKSIKIPFFGKNFLLTKKRKEKIFFYLLFISFFFLYFLSFNGKNTLILAATPGPNCPSACKYVWSSCVKSYCGDNAGCDCWYSDTQACTGRFDCCSAGDRCDCNEECASGLSCVNGVCGSCDSNPSGCQSDLDCGAGKKCDCWQECSGLYCWGDSADSYTCHSSCAPCGKYAYQSTECCSGTLYDSNSKMCYCCDSNPSGCQSDLDCGAGKKCDCNEECASGLSCVNGVCTSPTQTATVSVRVAYCCGPPTPQFTVDGVTYDARSTSYTFNWAVGSEHTIKHITSPFCDDLPSSWCGSACPSACAGKKGKLNVECWIVNGLEVVESSCQYPDNSYVKIKVDSDGGYVQGDYDLDCCDSGCGAYIGYCEDNTCKCKLSCETNLECAFGYCCTDASDGPRTQEYKCVGKGSIVSAGGKSYLCDPPGWISKS
jgi:hypothetical protein